MNKGISITSLVITISILIILVSSVTISGIKIMEENEKFMFASELLSIEQAISTYIESNLVLPASEMVGFNIENISDKTQFANEKIVNNVISLKAIDFSLLGITELKYGTGKYGVNDRYLISPTTNKIIYEKGLSVGNNTYYYLTNELKEEVGIKNTQIGKEVIITLDEEDYTKDSITATILVRKDLVLNNIKYKNLTKNLSPTIENGYLKYTLNNINVNGTLVVTYDNDKKKELIISNIDNEKPVIEVVSMNNIGGEKRIEINYYDSGSGVRKVKFTTEMFNISFAPIFFSTSRL